ncbi:unnamed protein product, partial [Meganyctiphanes norvegica]
MQMLMTTKLCMWPISSNKVRCVYRSVRFHVIYMLFKDNYPSLRVTVWLLKGQLDVSDCPFAPHTASRIPTEENTLEWWELVVRFGLRFFTHILELTFTHSFTRSFQTFEHHLNDTLLIGVLSGSLGLNNRIIFSVKFGVKFGFGHKIFSHYFNFLMNKVRPNKEACLMGSGSLRSQEKHFKLRPNDKKRVCVSVRPSVRLSVLLVQRKEIGHTPNSLFTRGGGRSGRGNVIKQPCHLAKTERDRNWIFFMKSLRVTGLKMEFRPYDHIFKNISYQHTASHIPTGKGLKGSSVWEVRFGLRFSPTILELTISGEVERVHSAEANVELYVVQDIRRDRTTTKKIELGYSSRVIYTIADVLSILYSPICEVILFRYNNTTGVRIVDGRVTDVQEAIALSRHNKLVDIFSASWGPTDDGTKVEGPGKLATQAFQEGITRGRDGNGTIFVWASGNGGIFGDNCNLDGYTSSIFTLSVSSITDRGESTFYGEPCASTLAAVYVGGSHIRGERQKRNIQVVVPELDGDCTEHFQGTSAAAPLMAGIVALALEANPSLSWRDVQQLVVESSAPTSDALKEKGWATNGIGKMFHLMQGYGAVNGGRLVELALNWKNLPPQKTVVIPMFTEDMATNGSGWYNISHNVDMTGLPAEVAITSLEHVVANVTLTTTKRQLWNVYIISPQGTTSQVLTYRPSDIRGTGFNDWPFMSVHFWGENPNGLWTVALRDESEDHGDLKKLALTLYG